MFLSKWRSCSHSVMFCWKSMNLTGSLIFYLTKLIQSHRFHVAMCLFNSRLQKTLKCGKNKKVAYKAIAEHATDVLTTFWRHVWSITGQMHSNMESVLYNKMLLTLPMRQFLRYLYIIIVFIELSAEKVKCEMAAAVASSWETITQNHRVARGISCRSLWTSMLGVPYFPFQER